MTRHAGPIVPLALFFTLSLLIGCSSVAVRTVRFTEVPPYPPTFPDLV